MRFAALLLAFLAIYPLGFAGTLAIEEGGDSFAFYVPMAAVGLTLVVCAVKVWRHRSLAALIVGYGLFLTLAAAIVVFLIADHH